MGRLQRWCTSGQRHTARVAHAPAWTSLSRCATLEPKDLGPIGISIRIATATNAATARTMAATGREEGRGGPDTSHLVLAEV
jgi:hypothetical protein